MNPTIPRQIFIAFIFGTIWNAPAIANPWSYWDYVDGITTHPTPCRIPTTTSIIQVYFDPGSLPSATVPAYQASLLRAISVWNEESRGLRVLQFVAGLPPKTLGVGQVVVTHIDNPNSAPFSGSGTFCDSNSSAHAYTVQQGVSIVPDVCSSGRVIYIFLKQCTSLASRNYTPGWVYNTETTVGVGQLSYEAVVIHELGHASFGYPDIPDQTGVMFQYLNPGNASSRLHLYFIDQNTSIIESGATAVHEYTRPLSDTSTWEGAADEYVYPSIGAGLPLSIGPGLAGRLPADSVGSIQVATAGLHAFTFRDGLSGSWNQTASIVPPSYPYPDYPSTVQPPAALWVRVAVSSYGEVVAAWPECTDLGHCRVATAWRTGSSGVWYSGIQYIEQPVFGPIEVEYDRWLDKFVVVGIALDGRLWSSHANAWTVPGWTTPYTGMQNPNDNHHFRFMGGLYFTLPETGIYPNPANVDVHGLLTIAAQDGTRPGQIFEHLVRWNNSINNFDLDSYPVEVDGSTLRHFEVARRYNSNDAISIWVDSNTTQQLRSVQRIGSIWGLYGASSPLTWNPSVPIYSSVSVAPRGHDPYHFVVGLSAVSP